MPNEIDDDDLPELDDHFRDVFARLAFHEYLLETLHFNLFRHLPNPEAELNQFRDDLLDRIRNRPPARESPVPESVRAVLKERMAEMAENFALKVSDQLKG